MATIDQQLTALATRMAQECNDIRSENGRLQDLATTSKSTLVAAINEVFGLASAGGGGGAAINDNVVGTATTWSSQKITAELEGISGGGAVIDDGAPASNKVWSSTNTNNQIDSKIGVAVGNLTKNSVGLGQVDNTSDANKPVSAAQATANAAILQAAKDYTDQNAGGADIVDTGTSTSSVWSSTKTNNTINSAVAGVTKTSLGLDQVDNTADINKPVSNAVQAALTANLNAAKAYTDAEAIGMWNDRGNYDASSNTFPAAGGTGSSGEIEKGNIWTISVAGTLGGTAVVPKQTVRALTNNPGQTASNWAINTADFAITQTITNGLTGQAPSADAVFDALQLKQNVLPTGPATQYFRADLSFGTFATDVRTTQLGGSVGASTPIVNTDTVLTGIWKAQAQIDTLNTAVGGLNKSSVGLGNVDNTSDVNKPVSNAQATADAAILTQAKAYTDSVSASSGAQIDDTVTVTTKVWSSSKTNTAINTAVAGVTKSSLGLGNVDNTSDANKPVSTAQAAADTAILNSAKSYADGLVVGLWDDRGNYNASGNAFPTTGGSGTSGAILKGDVWTISVAGTLGGTSVVAGQTVRAIQDTPGQTAANWAISASGGSVADAIVDGVTNVAPSQNAVFDALAGKQNTITTGTTAQYLKGDLSLGTLDKNAVGLGNVDNTSDANKPVSTAQAAADTAILNNAKSYADGLVVGLWDDRGNYNASGNTFPATGGSGASGAVLKGDVWTISVAGTLGGTAVVAGQTVRALQDTPGQTAANWAISTGGGQVADAITDGVTTVAPSQNAVFDALALKENVITQLPISKGGTGASTQAAALAALGGVAKAGDTLTGPLRLSHGADIATAATVNLDTATGDIVTLTGSTTITAITLADGARRKVLFTGAPTITNGASLVLPTSANIQVAAGDWAEFVGYPAGVVRMSNYMRANGTALSASTVINGATATTSAYTVDLNNGEEFDITTNGNFTLTLPTPTVGRSFVVRIKYGGVHTVTLAGGTVKAESGTVPTPTSVAGKIDQYVFSCLRDGSAWLMTDGGRNF